jgi:hypothetical protein
MKGIVQEHFVEKFEKYSYLLCRAQKMFGPMCWAVRFYTQRLYPGVKLATQSNLAFSTAAKRQTMTYPLPAIQQSETCFKWMPVIIEKDGCK